MALAFARLALPVESVMSRRVVQVLEGIPISEVHGIVQRTQPQKGRRIA